MPTGPKTKADSERPPDPATVGALAGLWQTVKHQAAVQDAKAKEMNQKLSALVGELGEPDDKGHFWLQGLQFKGWQNKNGVPTEVTYSALQRQKRVSVNMDEEEAVRICEKKGRLEDVSISYVRLKDPVKAVEVLREAGLLDEETFELVTEISVDKVRDLYYDEVISEEEYNDIFVEQVTWALLPSKI